MHKWYVFKECAACGIFWQGVKHDLSKFGPIEFFSSARYFQGNRSPIDAEKEDIGYSNAWLHHKGVNRHHWEYWTDFDKEGNIIAAKMPYKYVVEMVCDWIGAGKAYNQGTWNKHMPWEYYKKVRAGRHFHPETENLLVYFLCHIYEYGLDGFHHLVKNEEIKYGYEHGISFKDIPCDNCIFLECDDCLYWDIWHGCEYKEK